MSKFFNLEQYLRLSKEKRLELSFKNIEEIINVRLAPSAYKYREYWYPSKTHTLPNMIVSTGYDINKVDLENEMITLIKEN